MNIDFKDNETLIPVNQNQNQNQIQIPRHHMDSDSAFIGSWSSSSSSSFLTTSFGSELDSNDSDPNNDEDDEFIAQLTRQMADYMLDESDDNGIPSFKQSGFQNPNFQQPNQIHEQTRRSYADTVKKSVVGFQSEQSFTSDKQPQPPIQLYQAENQPRIEGGGWGRKGKMTESTQYVKYQMQNRGVNNGGKNRYGSSTAVGSGMRAIFLGGSCRNVTSGTGFFLPRSATDATDHSRKKSGCSTVLVPTRVLEALEQHFNNMESLSPSNTLPQAHHINHQVKDKTQPHESVSAVDPQDSKLPKEWIY